MFCDCCVNINFTVNQSKSINSLSLRLRFTILITYFNLMHRGSNTINLIKSLKMILVAGANVFGQWLMEPPQFPNFQALSTNTKNDVKFDLKQAELVHMNWSYNVFQKEKVFYLTGSWLGEENQIILLDLPKETLSSELNLQVLGNDYSLIIVDTVTHTMWFIDLEVPKKIKKVNIAIEKPFQDTAKKLKRDEKIIKVEATNKTCLCLTADGNVYIGFLPSHVDTSHCEGKVCDVQCGYEHFILLTDIGRVYTWGNGRRLQLGHGDINNQDLPTEVHALAGIKIVKISTGGWHTLALSEFGDLYSWGWNDTGQLGIKSEPDNQGVLKKEGIGSYPLPTVVDIYDDEENHITLNVKDIACGTRHSAVLLEDNSIWASGCNKYGQLGLSPETDPNVKYFKKTFQWSGDLKIRCGPWCTLLVNV